MREKEPEQALSEKEDKPIILPEQGTLTLSPSPHVHCGENVTDIMVKVLICLMPVIVASICVFGWNAIRVIILCTFSCVVFEALWCFAARMKTTVKDASAAVTGVLLALNLPPDVPWWICVVGSFIAIIIAKEVFGGLGQNPFNPAAVGRVALLVGFSGYMTTWSVPNQTLSEGLTGEITTCATPLGEAKMASGTEFASEVFEQIQSVDRLKESFIGNIGGSLGETSAVAILLGGILLIIFRLIKWQIPVAILGTTFVFTWLTHLIAPTLTPGPLFHIFSGGLMLGAFFMATDTVTSPITRSGAFFYGILIALITCVIRIWGSYPEGVSFAIVIMNALVPLLDKLFIRHPVGWSHRSVFGLNIRRGEIQ